MTRAVLMPDEVEKAERLNLSVCRQGKQDLFALPCAYHVDKKCSIYEERFKVCGGYQCEMLKRLLAGEVNLDQALEIVRMVQRLEQEIYQLLGKHDASKSVWDLFNEFLNTEHNTSGEALKSHPELLLKARMLSLLGNKYFEPKLDAELNAAVQPLRASIPS